MHSVLYIAVTSCIHHWWHADYSASAPSIAQWDAKYHALLSSLYLASWEVRNTRKLNDMLFKVMQWISVNCWVYILGYLDSCSYIYLNTDLPLKTKLFTVSGLRFHDWFDIMKNSFDRDYFVLWLGERTIVKICVVFFLALWRCWS